MGIKKGDPKVSLVNSCEYESHEVLNSDSSVVAVAVNSECACADSFAFSEWVSDHAVAGLKANLGLEGVLSNGTNHLEGNIWAIEQTCVIR